MIGHVATAIHFEEPDSQRSQRGFRYVEVSLLPGSPEGDNWWVLNEE
jgi:hypothetical protein